MQVYELHRLYQIQKILMKNIAKQKRQEAHQREFKNATTSNHMTHNLNQDSHKRTRQILDLERPAEECYNIADPGAIEDESELELTLGPSCYNGRRKAPESSDSAPSFSSSTDSHGKENSREDLKWGIELPAALNQSFLGGGGGGQKSSNVEELQFRQDRLNNPPWLFQALSLNMT